MWDIFYFFNDGRLDLLIMGIKSKNISYICQVSIDFKLLKRLTLNSKRIANLSP